MEARQCRLDDSFLVGCETRLSTSLQGNARISMAFWRSFNEQLKLYHVKQGKTFVKYALTLRDHGQLLYACGVPSSQLYPEQFRLYRIPRGEYLCFEHHGDMALLPDTIRKIFEEELPKRSITCRKGTLVYFEKYTERFHFHQDSSVIEIYVPLQQDTVAEMEEIEAKTILQGGGTTIGQFSWFGMDFNMNLYKGCNHGCIYCDSRSSCYQVQEFDRVRRKKDELLILERQLKGKRKKGVIGIGAMSDTYNPFEKQLEITRGALQLIDRYGFGVGIDTKSTMILRDLDILSHISSHSPVIVKVTITCADDALAGIIEPHAPSSSERFHVLEKLHQAGIYAVILMMPILPFINDTPENIINIVELAASHHAKFIFPAFGMTLRDNQRDYYYYQLDHYFPGKRKLYEHRYHNVYSCDSPHAARLYKLFKTECQKYGIRYRMNDIIRGYKKQQVQQGQLKL